MSSLNNTINYISNPFPGLRSFKYEEHHLFFGRDKQIEEVIDKLFKNKFVGVIGPSGIGKSSFMNCGILPSLTKNIKAEYSTEWSIISTSPGTTPLYNLAVALSKHEPEIALSYLTLSENQTGLIEFIKSKQSSSNRSNLLLFIDQFEELFRFAKTNTESQKEGFDYVKLLTNSIEQSAIPIYLIIAMRSDFIGECSVHSQLTSLINKSQFLIPHMTYKEKKEAILSPISIMTKCTEEYFADHLLNDAGDNADALPLLQHALSRTWEYWKNNSDEESLISLKHYKAIGGIEHALSIHAYEAYHELNDEQKIIAEKIFKIIAEKERESGRLIRRPTKLKEIMYIIEIPITEITTVIDCFRRQDRSLLIPSPDMHLNEESVIDISHESLIRIWPLLNRWVEEENESIKLLLKLSEAAALHQLGKTSLWRPPDLQIALNWQKKNNPSKLWGMRHDNTYERSILFLDFSKKEYEKEQLNKERQQKRKIIIMRIFTLLCLLGLTAAILLMLYGEQQRQKADRQSLLAKKQSALAKEQTLIAKQETKKATISKQEALEQEKIAKAQAVIAKKNEERANTEKEKAERATVEANHQQSLAKKALELARSEKEKGFHLRLLSIAKSMAVKSTNIVEPMLKGLVAQQAYLFNKNNGGKKHDPDIYDALYNAVKKIKDESYNSYIGHTQNVRALVSTDEGKYIYSAGSDGKIILWNTLFTRNNFNVLSENKSTIHKTLAISSDEKYLVSGGDYPYLQIIDLTQPNSKTKTIKGKFTDTWFLSYSFNNKGIIAGGSEKKILYCENNIFKEIYKSEIKINTIAADPSQNSIAVGNEKGQVLILDLNTNQIFILYTDPSEISIVSMSYNKEGKLLATGNEKGIVRIFDLSKYLLYVTLNGHNARVNNIRFSHNGKKLATASFDKTVRIWSMSNLYDPPIILKDHNDWVWSIAFSPDDEKLLAGCKDNLIRVWPTNMDMLANIICDKLNRNMNKKEWSQYVAEDIKYEKTCTHLK